MYINRPRLRFNGCYISKTTYVRPGENSFQDTNYQPWHLVTYFRYIRFFPEGLALLLTTADGPSLTVGHLRRRGVRHSALMKGCFSLKGNTVLAVFKKQHKSVPVDIHPRFRRRRDPNNNDGSTIVEQVFELVSCIRHWPFEKKKIRDVNILLGFVGIRNSCTQETSALDFALGSICCYNQVPERGTYSYSL